MLISLMLEPPFAVPISTQDKLAEFRASWMAFDELPMLVSEGGNLMICTPPRLGLYQSMLVNAVPLKSRTLRFAQFIVLPPFGADVVVSVDGNEIDVIALPLIAANGYVVTPSGMTIEVNAVPLMRVLFEPRTTVDGILISVKAEKPARFTDVRLVKYCHSLNLVTTSLIDVNGYDAASEPALKSTLLNTAASA